VNVFHPHVNHAIVRSNVQIEQLGVDQIHGDVEVLEAPCGNGVWHIERCPFTSHVQWFGVEKFTKHFSSTRIIVKPTSIGVLALTYSRLWS
jgi:hypothetical protein